MPPRWLTAVILLFWVGVTGWFFYREIWPYYRPGEPPPITFGLTDEVGGNTALWKVLFQDQVIGTGKSEVFRRGDGTYELSSEVKFLKLNVLSGLVNLPVDVNKLVNSFRVTPEGQLLRTRGKAVITFTNFTNGDPLQCNIDYRGVLENKMLTVAFTADQPLIKAGLEAFPQEPVLVDHNVMNTMHLLDRLTGLREGQYWTVRLFNPTGQLGIGAELAVPMLDARVTRGEMLWNDDRTACWKIEYRQPNKTEVVAATWVRRSDGLVLQQEASYSKMHLLFQREPVKEE